MRISAVTIAILVSSALAACGGPEQPEVVEQIVVREPGEAMLVPASAGDALSDPISAGAAAFAACTGCHTASPGEPSAAGPNLHGIVGREAGALGDFAYSDALVSSGVVWDQAQLDRYLADPSRAVPGTYMAAGAVPDDDRRAAIIAYLATLSE